MKETKIGFAEVLFPLVPLLVGIHFQSAAFVVAVLLTLTFIYSVAYYVVGSDENHETFIPFSPLIGSVGVALFFSQIPNATVFQKVLVLVAFAANYLVTLPLAVKMLRKANNEFAADILGILMSIVGLIVAAVLLREGMEAAAILAFIVTIFALPYPPKRKGGGEEDVWDKGAGEEV
jgi:tellurite resistance protein TehA-like permease